MPDITAFKKGVLRDGWTSAVDDYAISCEWALFGKVLIAGDITGRINGFDGTTGKTLWQLEKSHDELLAINVHPSGRIFASGGKDGRILLCDAQNGKTNKIIEAGPQWIEHIAWSPDGKWLAVTYSRKVIFFHLNGEERWRTEDHSSTVSAIYWSAEGELAVACYGEVTIYDIVNKSIQQKLEWKGSLVSMVLSPNGDIVACGSQDNSVHFWRRSTAQDSMMSGYPGKPANLTFDSSGTLLATSGSEDVTVWSFRNNGPEGTSPGILEFHNQPVATLSFAPKKMQLASGAKDGSIGIWSLTDDGNGDVSGATSMGTGASISCLAWRPDGRALAVTNAIGELTTWRIGN